MADWMGRMGMAGWMGGVRLMRCCGVALVAAALSVAWLAPCVAGNGTVAGIDITAYGLFDDLPREIVARQPSGRAYCPPLGVRHVRTTRYVPDSLFTRFGILFTVRGEGGAPAGTTGSAPGDGASSLSASFLPPPLPAPTSNMTADASQDPSAAPPSQDDGAALSAAPAQAPAVPPRSQWPDKVHLELRIEHPLMVDPISGKASTMEVWPLDACFDAPMYAGWMFTADWEQMRGDWTLSLYANGTRMASEVFQVVDPGVLGRIPLRVSLHGLDASSSDNSVLSCLAAGSYLNSLPRADVQARQLRGKGFPAFVGPPHVDGGNVWYTVYLGGYRNALAAGRDAALLRERHGVEARMLAACPEGVEPVPPVHAAREAFSPGNAGIATPSGPQEPSDDNGTDIAIPAASDKTVLKSAASSMTALEQGAAPGRAAHVSVPAGNASMDGDAASDGTPYTAMRSEGVWWVPVGEHFGAMAAAGQAVRLRDRGFLVKVLSLLDGGSLRYVVRVGPFADAQGAQAAALALAVGAGGSDGGVRKGDAKKGD